MENGTILISIIAGLAAVSFVTKIQLLLVRVKVKRLEKQVRDIWLTLAKELR